jgi:hypothetical protein
MRLKATKALKTKDLEDARFRHEDKAQLESDRTSTGPYQRFHYSPDEVISMGIALAGVLLQEKALGNQVVVVAPNGNKVAEFKEVEPRAIHDMAKEYIQSICPGMAEASATLLVAKLERERDF